MTQPLDKNENQKIRQSLITQLLQFGFDEQYVIKAVNITLDKQKAAQILMALVEEGPETNLTMYKMPIKPQVIPIQEGPMTEGGIFPIKLNKTKMILIVNGSLKMGKGKICAQVGHGVIGAYLQIEQMSKYDQKSRIRLQTWQKSGSGKIVVKAKDLKQMLLVKKNLTDLDININTYLVQDAGHTQIKTGSKTVLAIGPAFSDQIDPITENLKLL